MRTNPKAISPLAKATQFNDWFEVEMTDESVKARDEWVGKANDWAANGKRITRHEAVHLLRDVLTFEECREIMVGNSQILEGFTLINDDGTPFKESVQALNGTQARGVVNE